MGGEEKHGRRTETIERVMSLTDRNGTARRGEFWGKAIEDRKYGFESEMARAGVMGGQQDGNG